ncbi:MAG TPA: pyridoxamine 5'-phosphate oxidase family protein [Nevskiaceae bacterium]|nr:pyridoxamine 5'-phosphate oxidase family protein [Nevskiaceae bacterium]
MPTTQHAFDRLRELIQGIGSAVLVTHAPREGFHGRPMQTLEGPEDGRLLFFTSASSPKVLDLKRDARVSLVYADSSTHRYVFVTGRARLTVDRERFAKYFRATDKLWYPGGVDDPDLRMLEVTVERALYWTKPGLIGTAVALANAITGNGPREIGESGTLEFGPPSAADPETKAAPRRASKRAHNAPRERSVH